MKTILRYSILFLLLILSINIFSQTNEGTATICGRILFEKDSIYPLKAYSIIIEKSWPITFKQFEQVLIDTTDYSFKMEMDLNELTYGSLIVNFFRDIDSTTKARKGSWRSTEVPVGFFGSEYASRILFIWSRFVLEPGDSLNIFINYDKLDQHMRPLVTFSGKGGANNNLKRSREVFFKGWSKNFRLPLTEGLSKEDLLMHNELESLSNAKDSISQAYYELLRTDILFDNLRDKHALIRASLYGLDLAIEEKRKLAREHYAFIDTLTLRSEHLNSAEFRGFLNFYLEYVNRIITGEDIPYSMNEESYYLAKAVFKEDVLKAFLYERLNYQIETLDFYPKGIFQYKEFIDQFPDSPESHRLTQIYNKHFPVTNGQPAPDLELFDSLGNTAYLSDLRGKVVFLSNYFPGFSVNEENEKQI